MEQISMFEMLYPTYKIEKPIRLIELFAGYGSQALALKYLGVNFEQHKIVEWAVKSIEAYNDIHFGDHTDYSKGLTDTEVLEYLVDKGISMDYNQPMTRDQIKRKSIEWQRKAYNDIIATHNLVDISRVHAQDLEIRGGYEYIMTYSFPCQDLSLAGKGKGMSRESGTRSGLLWQVERILLECKELGSMPNVLIMENVPEVKGSNNIGDFTAWVNQLERLGYSNYCDILNAKEYGVPQNRRRCFMVSILGEWNYKMPKPMKLKHKLKDLLENNVDDKYYLSKQMINYIYSDTNAGNYHRSKARESADKSIEKGIAVTISTRAGGRPTDNFIQDTIHNKKVRETLEQNEIPDVDVSVIDGYNRKIKTDGVSTTINTGVSFRNQDYLLIKNATKEGFLEAEEGDGIDISSRMEHHRGTVQKGSTQTLTTGGGNEVGVVVIGNYSPSNHDASRIVDSEGLAPTVKENHGTITAIKEQK